MKQTSEQQKDLNYVVDFEDGLSPRLAVYGIDPEGNVYGVKVYFGTSIQVGNEVKTAPRTAERKRRVGVRSTGSDLKTSFFENEMRLKSHELNPDWEEDMKKHLKEEGVNVVRVQNPDQIPVVIKRYRESYEQQFAELSEQLKALYDDFVTRYEIIGRYEKPVSILDFNFVEEALGRI